MKGIQREAAQRPETNACHLEGSRAATPDTLNARTGVGSAHMLTSQGKKSAAERRAQRAALPQDSQSEGATDSVIYDVNVSLSDMHALQTNVPPRACTSVSMHAMCEVLTHSVPKRQQS
eukprot:3414838-Amphidinium_carterae.2